MDVCSRIRACPIAVQIRGVLDEMRGAGLDTAHDARLALRAAREASRRVSRVFELTLLLGSVHWIRGEVDETAYGVGADATFVSRRVGLYGAGTLLLSQAPVQQSLHASAGLEIRLGRDWDHRIRIGGAVLEQGVNLDANASYTRALGYQVAFIETAARLPLRTELTVMLVGDYYPASATGTTYPNLFGRVGDATQVALAFGVRVLP